MDGSEQIKLADFIAANGLTMESRPAESNPNAADDAWSEGASHWVCRITNPGGMWMDVPYSQGSAYRRWIQPGGSSNRLPLTNLGFAATAKGHPAPHDIRTKYAPVKGVYEKESVDLANARKNCTEPTPPNLESVLDCLASDVSSYDNARDFEDWASEYGYDTDSRKAERAYRVIGEQAKLLRHLLGSEAYETLLWKVERL